MLDRANVCKLGRLNFTPLLVLTRRGAAPVKTSTGNNFLEIPEISPTLLPVLVLNSGGVSAPQYCTGNFTAPSKAVTWPSYTRDRLRKHFLEPFLGGGQTCNNQRATSIRPVFFLLSFLLFCSL